jgi:hypothetical protein
LAGGAWHLGTPPSPRCRGIELAGRSQLGRRQSAATKRGQGGATEAAVEKAIQRDRAHGTSVQVAAAAPAGYAFAIAIAHDILPFSNLAVTSASHDRLAELAMALERLEAGELEQLLATRRWRVRVLIGERNQVSTSGDCLDLKLTREACISLGAALAELREPDELLHFSAIDGNLAATSVMDWCIRLDGLPERRELDYQPAYPQVMWDAIVFHPPPTLERWLEAWAAIAAWSRRGCPDDGGLYLALADTATERLAPAEAFARYRAEPDAWHVRGFRRHRFARHFGDARDWVQIWFGRAETSLIVHDHHAATGVVEWDVANVRSLAGIAVEIARILGADRFAFGLEVDDLSSDDAQPIAELGDADALLCHLPLHRLSEAALRTALN